jgi:hypothetical protein
MTRQTATFYSEDPETGKITVHLTIDSETDKTAAGVITIRWTENGYFTIEELT